MAPNLSEVLKVEKIQGVTLRPVVLFSPESSIEKVVQKMGEEKTGCVLVQNKEKLVGIFTERDLLTRVMEPALSFSTPVEKVMSRDPKCLKETDSVSEAIRLMNQGGYRHIPIVDAKGKPLGILSVKGVVRYLAEHFPYEVYNLPPDPRQIQRAPEGA